MSDHAALVMAGLRAAARLGVPLHVSGRDVYLPADFCAADEDTSPSAEMPLDRPHESPWEGPRRIAFAMSVAAREIESLGLSIGILEPPPPAPPPIVAVQAREPEPLPPPVVEVDGEVHVGFPAFMAVRSSDNGASWHCVRLGDNTLQSWHSSRQAAIDWALAAVKEDPRRGPGNEPFTYPPRLEE